MTDGAQFPTRFYGVADEPRLIWNPLVHRQFGEDCYYYVISGEDGRGKTLIEELQGLLDRLQIPRGSAHVVFGPYDVLLRIWLTRAARQQFLRSLRHSDGGETLLDSLQEFTVEEQKMFTGDTELFSPEIEITEDLQEGIADLAAIKSGDVPHGQFKQLDQMINAGVVGAVRPAAGEKLYVFMRAKDARTIAPSDQLFGTIHRLAREAEMGSISIYRGVGFSDYILKAIVPNYASALPAVEHVQAGVAMYRLHAWSLVPADFSFRQQGEQLGLKMSDVPDDLTASLAQAADPGIVANQLQALPPDQLNELVKIHRHLRRNMESSHFERFNEVLAYTVAGDRKNINRTLSFLTTIEGDLRYVLPRLARKYHGPSWISQVRQDPWASRELGRIMLPSDPAVGPSSLTHLGPRADFGDQRAKPPSLADGWSLADLLQFGTVLKMRWPDSLSTTGFRLDWPDPVRAQEILQLRDAYASFRLQEAAQERDYLGSWGRTLHMIGHSISFQIDLEFIREELGGQKGE